METHLVMTGLLRGEGGHDLHLAGDTRTTPTTLPHQAVGGEGEGREGGGEEGSSGGLLTHSPLNVSIMTSGTWEEPMFRDLDRSCDSLVGGLQLTRSPWEV